MRWLFALRREPPWLGGKLLALIAVVLVFLGWALATSGIPEERAVSPTVLPSPGEVVASLDSLVHERALVKSIVATLTRVFLGFGLAVLVGVPLGLFAGSFRAVEAFLSPLIIFGRNIPIAALTPLTIFGFGIGESQKVMFIFIATVPFLFSDTFGAPEIRTISDHITKEAERVELKRHSRLRGRQRPPERA